MTFAVWTMAIRFPWKAISSTGAVTFGLRTVSGMLLVFVASAGVAFEATFAAAALASEGSLS
jgi:hypothetical protein